LRELSVLPVQQLHGLIFTLDKRLCEEDISKIDKITSKVDNLVKGLKCMRGIDEEFLPTFKFFQFKKSKIKDTLNDSESYMLCFSDISQKILYDTSKAEGELLSLINSTISHEMRNPLNSIINQCKIIYAYLNQLQMVIN
jgi:hypothetical protein